MSEELTDKEQVEKQAAKTDELGQLMGSADSAGTESRLERDAVQAAEAAIQAAESALRETKESSADTASAPVDDGARQRRIWMLRGVLVLNFALMGVMIALPGPAPVETPTTTETHTDPATDENSNTTQPPFVEPLRDERLMLPADKKYDEALIAGRDGDYELAARLMHDYIRAHPGLDPALMHGAYVNMARYLHLAGRSEEAIEYETVARRMVGSSHLPADLWRTARAAEERGDVRGMRQAYARLLLQQNMLTPSQLSVITEAYLKFGESYRLEAALGEAEARDVENDRLRRLRENDRRGGNGK